MFATVSILIRKMVPKKHSKISSGKFKRNFQKKSQKKYCSGDLYDFFIPLQKQTYFHLNQRNILLFLNF